MDIELFNDCILVEVKQREEKTASGVVISKTPTHGEPIIGEVIAFGKGKIVQGVGFVPIDSRLEVGKKILFRYGEIVPYEGKNYVLITQEDLIWKYIN